MCCPRLCASWYKNLSLCHKNVENDNRSGKGSSKRNQCRVLSSLQSKLWFCLRSPTFSSVTGKLSVWTLLPSALPQSKPRCTALFGVRIARSRKKSSDRPFSTLPISSAESKVRRPSRQFAPKPASNDFQPGSSPTLPASRANTNWNFWVKRPDAACHDANLAAALSVDRCSGLGGHSCFLGFTASPLWHFNNELL